MATFKTCVRKQRKDGFWPVYIRVVAGRKVAYIKTDKLVTNDGLRNGEVTDPYVMQHCTKLIVGYVDRLNRHDTSNWTLNEVMEFIQSDGEDVCFSDYARKHNDNLVNTGHERNAKNYELALQHMERYAGTNKVMFSQMTSTFVNGWIKSMESTHRAKEMYPVCMRQVFKAACRELNDYDRGIIRIKTNPWVKVDIPSADRPEKLAITPQACRAFFGAPLPESKMKSPLPELGRDVAMMVLCLGGINTVDLYLMQKENYYDGILHYNRAKTRNSRADEAYMEMRVPQIIRPLMDKYAAEEDDRFLFCFHKRHSTSDSFSANVNIGIKAICKSMGMEKKDYYCVYTFRHTWATVAQNDCEARIDEVAFGMNHSSGHKVTRGYMKLDFSPAWELNEKVVELIFFTDKESHREKETDVEEKFERFSKMQLMSGKAFFMGRVLAEVEDVGFSNVDEIISRLASMLPDNIPERCMVQFRIENKDKKQTAIYERMKGKGF